MNYREIWRQHAKIVISMSLLLSWLWAFPLFGFIQDVLITEQTFLLPWNVSFLIGLILGFGVLSLLTTARSLPVLLPQSPLIIFGLTLCWLIYTFLVKNGLLPHADNQPLHLIFHLLLPFGLGLVISFFFALWGSTLYYFERNKRGRYMGLMMTLASCVLILQILVSRCSLLCSVLLLCSLPLLSWRFSGALVEYLSSQLNSETGSRVFKDKQLFFAFSPAKIFWIPFALILLCYYLLSGVVHQTLFPLIREASITATVLGPFFYGIAALLSGALVDKRIKAAMVAVFCLAFLGISFLVLPAANYFHVFAPLQILLESSYALIDLFIWYILAEAAHILGKDPVRFYGRGLFLNISFIIAGVWANSYIEHFTGEYGFFHISLAAGIILFAGTMPALYLLRIEPTPDLLCRQEISNVDSLTCKEKEVIQLIFLGTDYNAIQEELCITKNTLKTHLRHIYEKTGVKNRSELILKFKQS